MVVVVVLIVDIPVLIVLDGTTELFSRADAREKGITSKTILIIKIFCNISPNYCCTRK